MLKFTPKFVVLIFLIALAFTPAGFAQDQLAGDWTGVLNAGGQNFRVAWHVAKAADGSVTSTFDNLDEGTFGIKIKSIVLNGSDITLSVDDVIHPNGQDVRVRGTFAGRTSKDFNEVTGTWTQTEPEASSADIILKRAQPAAPAVSAPTIAGDWKGTLVAGGAEIRLAFHFAKGKDGILTGTLDSVDQGHNGIPLTSVTLDDGRLSIVIESVRATYGANVNADASAITGIFSQGTPIHLTLARGTFPLPPKPAAPTEIDGTWQGTIDLGATKLRILYKIENTEDGLTAKMQSPDQNPAWTSAYLFTRNGSSIVIPIKVNGSIYEAKLSSDLSSMDGTFKQGSNAFPLALKHVKE